MAWPLTMDDFDAMQHRLFFDRLRTSDPTPTNPEGVPTYFMMPDANVSGPIKKDKTFFFFGYQRLHEKKIAQDRAGVPTPAMKAGNFTMGGMEIPSMIQPRLGSLPMAPGSVILSRAMSFRRIASIPWLRSFFRINPWHSPNIVGGDSSTGPSSSDPNLEYNEFAKVFFDDFNVRIDHQFSNNLKAYGSWTHNRQNGLGPATQRQVFLISTRAKGTISRFISITPRRV